MPLSVPIDFEWGKWCLHLFSVAMNSDFIKLTGNEDRHKILDRFKFWSYLTSHLGVDPALQQWKKWCLQLFSVTFDWVFVKLAGNEDRHKSSNKFEFGSDRFIHFGVICPWAPIFNPWGYIHVLNHEQNCIKSDFKEISLKLATNG